MGYGSWSIDDWVSHVHRLAVDKGWWDGAEGRALTADEILSKLMLVVSELAEATERVRVKDFRPDEFLWTGEGAKKPDGFGVELADAVIRIMDLCGRLGIDLENCIRQKSAYNSTREKRHGGKRA